MGKKEEKKETLAQKYANEFETLTKTVIEFIFSDVEHTIKTTRKNKDGGVDVDVKIKFENKNYKIFVESKLRKNNLQLRDISANVIIAFNKGAISLIAVTNNNFTPQLETELHDFSSNTYLNIKILIGKQIKEILEKINKTNDFPHELIGLLSDKKNNSKELQSLKIDFESFPLFNQFIRPIPLSNFRILNKFPIEWEKKGEEILEYLNLKQSVIVSGIMGNGKTTFINFILEKNQYRAISVNCFLFKTIKDLCLSILMNIWNITQKSILENFQLDTIDNIVETLPIDDKEGFKKILLYLLDKNTIMPSSIFNEYIVCYLFKGISLFENNLNYVFHIQNIQQASQEIVDFINFILRTAIERNVPCIIDFDEDIFNPFSSEKYFSPTFLIQLKLIKIPLLTNQEACNYLYSLNKNIPKKLIEDVIGQCTPHMANLQSCYYFINEIYSSIGTKELENSIKNKINIVEPIVAVIYGHDSSFKEIMILLYLCERIIPIEIYRQIIKNNDAINRLIYFGYINIQGEYIYAKNTLSLDIIENYVQRFPYDLKDFAERIDDFIGNDKKYYSQKIYILGYLGKYEIAIQFIEQYYVELKEAKQYTQCLNYINKAIDYSEIINDYETLNKYLCQYIEILVSIKNVFHESLENMITRINNLKNMKLCSHSLLIRYDFLIAMQFYKIRNHQKAMNILKPYYTNFINSKKLSEEWEGLLTVRYALCIKEIYGNLKALEIFETLYKLAPDNHYIFNGYHSHVPCTLFYNKPDEAKNHYIQMQNKYLDNERKYPIPFHLYADIAMTDLLKHDFDECKISCEKSIRLSSSYSIYDELGRSYNILGCVYLCENNYKEAYHYFSDSLYMLSTMQYKSFEWRTWLNLIHTGILLNYDKKILTEEFKKCYEEIKDLYSEKIMNLCLNVSEFYKSREYFALLLIKDIAHKLNIRIHIMKDFNISRSINDRLNRERLVLEEHKNTASLKQCSYVYLNILFTVG